MNKIFSFLFLLFFCTIELTSQTNEPFQIQLEALHIDELAGVQSFAWGQADGKWLIVGGRLDGLHRRQPFASFDLAGHNNLLIVIDPIAKKKWTMSLKELDAPMQEQLSSTNMEFYQEDGLLYLIGGYGYSATADDHITFPALVSVKLSEVINAVINNKSTKPFIKQYYDKKFAVTGGYLNKIYDKFYLTGGQNFIGLYNPMGPTHGPGFFQKYTNAIRIFAIDHKGDSLHINHIADKIDSINLHRRDLNVLPQIMPNGEEGLTMFSGVFQANIDLPYLNAVNIDSSGYSIAPNFNQYFNHYQCAHIPMYSKSTKEMHNVFFGGIAQYYMKSNVLTKDDNAPFVNTIARVTRSQDNTMKEYKMPVEMPALLGAGSEFIPNKNVPMLANELIDYDLLNDTNTLIGYIFGGISSSAPNVFFINDGSQSTASNTLYKVWLKKNLPLNTSELSDLQASINLRVYPNPNNGKFDIHFNLAKSTDVNITITDTAGNVIEVVDYKNLPLGENTIERNVEYLKNNNAIIISLTTKHGQVLQQCIINK